MRIIETIAAMREFSSLARKEGRAVTLVPTMGALHRGHGELFKVAKRGGGVVVASIFVNPTQFGEGEDFGSYPKQLEADKKFLEGLAVDALFLPRASEIYPDGFSTFIEVGELSSRLCGRTRPGHFRGVATIVSKFFNIVRPKVAVFGLKDFQQFLVIKQMTWDLDMGVELIGVETVREADGLAISSRNTYLSSEERKAALVIPRALKAAKELFAKGEREAVKITEIAKKTIENEPLTVIDYIELCDCETLVSVERIEKEALLAVAVKIAGARLIDNTIIKA